MGDLVKKILLLMLLIPVLAWAAFEFSGPLIDLSGSWTTARLVSTTTNGDGNVQLDTLDDLSDFVAGTANQITVTADGSGGVTLSTPQDIGTGSSPTFLGLTATGTLEGATITEGGVGVYNQTQSDAAYEAELDDSAGLLAALSDETGTGVAVFGTSPTFTTDIIITGADANPTAAGMIVYDSTISGLSGGGLRWYDDDSIRVLVDLETDPTDDDYVVAYDAAADGFYMKVDAGAAGGDSIEIDSVAVVDPDFQDTDSINVTDTANVVTLDVKANGILESMLKAVDEPADEEYLTYEETTGDFEWQAGSGGTQDFADVLGEDPDGGDVDQTSLGKLEFFDAGLYLDADADGVMDITSDGTLELHSADWDISTTGVATGMGNITSDGSFIIGGASMNETDLEKLDGITNGTAAANKALVLDASLDIGTINILTATSLVGALTGNADTVTTNANLTGDVTSSGNAATINEITANNLIFVGIADNIETAVAAATAGDTLVLAAGTYTITDDIDIAKAITIRGQGRKATIIACTTDSKNAFHITAASVALCDMRISIEASATKAVLVDGTAGAVLTDVVLENVDVVLASHAGAQYALYFRDAKGVVRNCEVKNFSTDASAWAMCLENAATAEGATTLYAYDSYFRSSGGGGTAIGAYAYDNSATQNCYIYLYDCYMYGAEAAACTSYGIAADGGDAYVTAHFSVLSGTDYSAGNLNSAGGVTIRACLFGNSTTTGTISRSNELNIGSLIANSTIKIIEQDDPTTDEDGEMAVDTDGWGLDYDALEFFNHTASAYVVATTASDTPTNGQVPTWNTGGEITWETVSGSFDSTTVDATTWSDNANASNAWTFDVSGTDHTMTAGSGMVTFSHDLTILGDDLFMATNYDKYLLVGDGTNFNPVESTGDVIISNDGSSAIQANSVALTTDTTGSYAASSSEAGPATSLAASGVDAITEIAAALKSGDDGTLITGTAGTNAYISQWNADGDLVDGIALSTVGVATGDTWTGTHDFGGATAVEIENGTDPDLSNVGELSVDTDGANETGDVIVRATDGTNQFPVARKIVTLAPKTIIRPQDFADATRDRVVLWTNNTGMVFTVTEIRAWSDTDDTDVTLEIVTATNFGSPSTLDALSISTNGTGVFTCVETTISDATVAHDEIITADFDDTDDPGQVTIEVSGWYNADID